MASSTSLHAQLKRLKTAPTHALAVERDRASLLFDAKDAAGYDREDFYRIGALCRLVKRILFAAFL